MFRQGARPLSHLRGFEPVASSGDLTSGVGHSVGGGIDGDATRLASGCDYMVMGGAHRRLRSFSRGAGLIRTHLGLFKCDPQLGRIA
jgi:hypothetical protein